MKELQDFEQQGSIQKYQGMPRKSSSSERTRWQKFWGAVLPWLNKKYEQAERRLEAEVAVKEAEAKKLLAEAGSYQADANLKNAQALEIIQKAKFKEAEIFESISRAKITETVIDEFRAKLEEKINMQFLLKSTVIMAKLEEKPVEEPPPAIGSAIAVSEILQRMEKPKDE